MDGREPGNSLPRGFSDTASVSVSSMVNGMALGVSGLKTVACNVVGGAGAPWSLISAPADDVDTGELSSVVESWQRELALESSVNSGSSLKPNGLSRRGLVLGVEDVLTCGEDRPETPNISLARVPHEEGTRPYVWAPK